MDYISGVSVDEEMLEFPEITDILKQSKIKIGFNADKRVVPYYDARELVTEGIDNLEARLSRAQDLGASYARWQACYTVGSELPSPVVLELNSNNMARFAYLSQQNGMLPLLEIDIMTDGKHSIYDTMQTSEKALSKLFFTLNQNRVLLECIVLKLRFVGPGDDCKYPSSMDQMAELTYTSLYRSVPPAVKTIFFVSCRDATTSVLNRFVCQNGSKPWNISFSLGTELMEKTKKIWDGKAENMVAAQKYLLKCCLQNSMAASGRFYLESTIDDFDFNYKKQTMNKNELCNAVYIQSGGMSPTINETAYSVIHSCRRVSDRIGTLYASYCGVKGLINEEMIDTIMFDDYELDQIRYTPGGIFNGDRTKLRSYNDDPNEYERIYNVLKAHNIKYVFFNGGVDSFSTATQLNIVKEKFGWDLTIIGIPKTINNDLVQTDFSPGFGSAAKYCVIGTLEASIDLKSMCLTSTKVMIIEVMGRYSGWLAAATGIIRKKESDPPHIILMPEVPYDEAYIFKKVKDCVAKIGYCTIVVAEGIKDLEGKVLSTQGTTDQFGNIQMGGVAAYMAKRISEQLKLKYHYCVLDYLQRANRHVASKVDAEVSRRVGEMAVEYAMNGLNNVSPMIRRISNSNNFDYEIYPVELRKIIGQVRYVPHNFINGDNISVSEECKKYIIPLLDGEQYVPIENGKAKYFNFDAPLHFEPKLLVEPTLKHMRKSISVVEDKTPTKRFDYSHDVPEDKWNAFYAQSGGMSAVINESAYAIINACRKNHKYIGKLYAGANGILGVLNENLIDTSVLTDTQLQYIRKTPGGVFGTSRYKLKSFELDPDSYKRIIEVFKAHKIKYVFFNGGNDSADTSNKLSKISKQFGYELNCIGVPKTIDNDLPLTDFCPGFGSAAKYVALSTQEVSLDTKAMCMTSTQVYIMEVMGRHAGWLAAASGIIKDTNSDPPHIILFPEVPYDETKFCEHVKKYVELYGYCVVVASEGVKDTNGKFLSDSGLIDAFGHSQLGGVAPYLAEVVQSKLGLKQHYTILDYLQRSGRHIASRVDAEIAFAVGMFAVEYAVQGKNAIMPLVKRTNSYPYKFEVFPADLKDVANVEKFMPKEFITEDGYGITEECKQYLIPLTEGEVYPEYEHGVPMYFDGDFQIEKKLVQVERVWK